MNGGFILHVTKPIWSPVIKLWKLSWFLFERHASGCIAGGGGGGVVGSMKQTTSG